MPHIKSISPPLNPGATEAEKKAAARAYALSSTSSGKKKNKKNNNTTNKPRSILGATAASAAMVGRSRDRSASEEAAVSEAAASLLGASRMPPRVVSVAGAGGGAGGGRTATTQAASSSPPAPPPPSRQQQKNFDLLATAASQHSQPSTPAKPKQHGFGAAAAAAAAAAPAAAAAAAAAASPTKPVSSFSPGPVGATITIAAPPAATSASATAATAPATTADATVTKTAMTSASTAAPSGEIDNDDEYAKFVRSLCQYPVLGPDDDLASLISRGGTGGGGVGAPTDDEDDGGSYQLQSDESDYDDDDDELAAIILGSDDDGQAEQDDDEEEGVGPEQVAEEAVGAAARGKRRSLRASSGRNGSAAKSSAPSTPTKQATPRSLNLYSEGANSPVSINHNLNIMAEIEAELSMLMEEDMDAAVSTLLGGHVGPSSSGGGSSGGSGAPASGSVGSVHVGKGSTTKTSAGGAAAASNPPTGPLLASTPSHPGGPTITAGGSKVLSTPKGPNGAITGAPIPTSASNNPPPTPKANTQLPTSAQIIELRYLMSAHYQLLLQQSVLAVRSANLHRHQKGGEPGHVGSAYSRGGGGAGATSTVNAAAALVSAKKGGSKQGASRGDNPVLEPADFFFGGESADDLAEILDGAVGMLQDLDENRKDGIRNALQLEVTRRRNPRPANKNKTKKGPILPLTAPSSAKSSSTSTSTSTPGGDDDGNDSNEENLGPRRLTRSAFQQTLKARDECAAAHGQESNQSWSHTNYLPISTSFDVKGLSKLDSSFASIDSSVDAAAAQRAYNATAAARALSRLAEYNVLEPADNGDACEMLLQEAGAHYNKKMIPGRPDPSEHLSYPQELLGEKFKPPMSKPLQILIRKNRSQFTSAEDNLVLRGVNLYGEKEWLMLSDRFLPDRSVSAISQRYSRLCLLIYRAAGVRVGPNGDLDPPPKHPNGAEDFDVEAISKISPVEPPARFNVHRWSLDEDITLLKAVPLMGYMWAEIGNRLIKHRDRGHLRKRYQVLERRVKATVKREKKMPTETLKEPAKGRASAKAPAPRRSVPVKPITAQKAMSSVMPASKKAKPTLSMPKSAKTSAVAPPAYGAFPPPHEAYPAAYYYYPPPVTADGSTAPTATKPGEYPSEAYPYPPYYPPYGYYYPEGGYVPPEGYDNNSAPSPQGVTSSSAKLPNSTKSDTAKGVPNKPTEARHPGAQFHAQANRKATVPRSGSLLAKHPIAAPKKSSSATRMEAARPSQTLSTSDVPVKKSSTPSGPLSQESQGDESTRMGLERILKDDEWSQMSRVKKMIESGEDGMKPRGIAKDIERLPSIHATDQDASGLSMLNNVDEVEAATTKGTSGQKSSGGSIMSSVLERANSRSSSKRASSAAGRKRKGSAMERQHSLERAMQAVHGTPTKGAAPRAHDPLTPMAFAGSGEMPTIAETPGEIGSLMASLKSPPKGSPSAAMKSPGLTGDALLMMRSPGGGMINMDGFEISNFSTCGDGLSRLAMTATGSMSRGAFGTNSLMETDLEAISALNALSNPPTPHVSAPNTPQKPVGLTSSRTAPVKGDTGISLFAKAVGQLTEKDAKSKSKRRRID